MKTGFTLAVLLMSTSLSAKPLLPETNQDLETIIDAMSIEEKVGQLLLIGFSGKQVTPHIKRWVGDRKVGGVAIFARNIESTEQIARFTRGIQSLTRRSVPAFISLDQEGGNVIRLKDGATVLPGNMALGATRSTALSYVAGQALGTDLKRLGFNMNLAPVLDVNSNPRNPVIGIRSYGEKPELVGALGTWFVRGQQEAGVTGVAKHFPGHGDTQSDSHFAMPSIPTNIERLRNLELVPFERAIAAGLDAVMTAHIALPKVAEEPNLPATLSYKILTEELRERMGFEGIVITDGLEMQGIVEQYGAGTAAVRAILAGADMAMILWTNSKKEEVYRALIQAVKRGTITMDRLDQSVRRILRVKLKRDLFKRDLPSLRSVIRDGNRNKVHRRVAERIATESITLVRNHGDVLPLRSVRYRKVVVMSPSGEFANTMAKPKFTKVFRVPYRPSRARRSAEVKRMVREGKNADALVMVAVNRYHITMIKEVTRQLPHVPVTVVSFASPYYLESMPDVDGYVCTYSYQKAAQRAAAKAILGKSAMTGRLPVTIPGFYEYGHRANHPMTLSRQFPQLSLHEAALLR
jgi:beta-N-acetylhexosaminidase